ncbi:hypothetical protein KXW36_000929, partial [Aspergillus fumigatus]
MSMIPTSTGAAKAIGLVLPELKGKLDGVAIRVPTPNVSVVDLKIIAKRATDAKEINAAMKRASEQQLKGILGYTSAPNVSIDFNHDPHSSTIDALETAVIDGKLVTGRLGEDVSTEDGYAAARACGLMLLAQLKAALGSLDRVERIVKLGAFINSSGDYTDQPKVANGVSELMVA